MHSLIDTHCHLYAAELAPDIDEVIARAIEQNISHIYMPNIDSTSIQAMYSLEQLHPHLCTALMGLHPCYVKENYVQELKIIEKEIASRAFKGIGEIGLDFYWDKTFEAEQKKVFITQLQWAQELNIPAIIHSRESTKACIDCVKEVQKGNLTGIFHCFSGSTETAKEIIDLNFSLGIGGVITYKKNNLLPELHKIPLQKIVLETDAPYLAPTPHRGKRNESAYLTHIAQTIAQAYNVTLQDIALQTTLNAQNIFKQA